MSKEELGEMIDKLRGGTSTDKIKELDTKLKKLRTLPETPTEKDRLRTVVKAEKEKDACEVVI